jgi:hypothetical protein
VTIFSRNFRRRYILHNPGLHVPSVIDCKERDSAEFGVVYLVLGQEYARLATLSIRHLRYFGYKGRVRVVADIPEDPWSGLGVEVWPVASVGKSFRSRYYKTRINEYAFPETLYLDVDTIPIASIDDVWTNLQNADLSVGLQAPRVRDFINYYWNRSEGMRPELSYMDQLGLTDRPFYNSGVLLFRRTGAVDRFFETWHQEWQRFRGHDQSAFVRALARTGVEMQTLPGCWNTRHIQVKSIAEAQNQGVKILHFLSGPQRDVLERLVQNSL